MRYRLALLMLLTPFCVQANPTGLRTIQNMKQCIMSNDTAFCHSIITPASYEIYDKIYNYKLTPCLPTNLTFESEEQKGNKLIVKTSFPSDTPNRVNQFRVVMIGNKIDIPQSFQLGFGEKWQDKINLAEQLYLMMRANMQDKLSCDMLTGLLSNKK